MEDDMTESFITGGTVAIEDGLKAKEEFAPARKAKVEISFSVPEGADPAFATEAAKWFHEAGVPKSAAQALVGKWNEFVTAQQHDRDVFGVDAESGAGFRFDLVHDPAA